MADDYDADRQRVAEGLVRLLQWDAAAAAAFVRTWRIGDVDDAWEHLASEGDARVALAAIVYGVRERQADGDPAQRQAALREADQHALLFSRKARLYELPPTRPKPIYSDPCGNVAEVFGHE